MLRESSINQLIVDREEGKEDIPNSGRPTLSISPPLKLASEDNIAYLPTPLPSSAANTPVAQNFTLPPSDGETSAGGRERRTRKSVNYAEPKLNTYVFRNRDTDSFLLLWQNSLLTFPFLLKIGKCGNLMRSRPPVPGLLLLPFHRLASQHPLPLHLPALLQPQIRMR